MYKKNDKFFVINEVKIWDSEENQFYEFIAMIKYNKKTIDIYLNEIPGVSNNIRKLINSTPILDHQWVEVIVSDLEYDDDYKLVTIGSTKFKMKSEDAFKMKSFYEKYYDNIDIINNKKQSKITKLYYKINGIDSLAINFIETLDNNLLLNHDILILCQKLFAYNQIREIELYDENITGCQDVLMSIQTLLENMAEIVLEDNEITEQEAKYVCWEAIKKASVIYYSGIWEKNYGKYINEPLRQNQSEEADGTLDRYIENVILCNEIDHDNKTILGIFTYYMIEKGYAPGTLYFPAYFDIIVQAFDVIGENIRKIGIKKRLKKGGVKKSDVQYTIDDIDMMNGNEFEHFIFILYSKMGYSTKVTKKSGDQGIDIIAEKNGKRIGIQAKCYSAKVGNSAIQEVVAGKNFYRCEKAVVVTNNFFTLSAIELANANDVILWDRDILKEKIKELI